MMDGMPGPNKCNRCFIRGIIIHPHHRECITNAHELALYSASSVANIV